MTQPHGEQDNSQPLDPSAARPRESQLDPSGGRSPDTPLAPSGGRPPEPPLVVRSHRLRVIGIVTSVLLVALALLGWFALPPEIKVLFTPWQQVALLGILAVIVFLLATMAASYVKADGMGLRIRNGLRRHEVPWSRVHKIILRPGDPWAQVLLKPADGRPFEAGPDVEKRQLMGIQATDGAAARAAVEELRRRQQSLRRDP